MDQALKRTIVAEYVRGRLRAEVGAKRGKAAEIARETGITTAHISNMTSMNPTRGVGPETIDRLSDFWGFKSYAELEATALAEHEKRPVVPPPSARPDRYPSREATVDWARRVGYSERAISDLQSWALKADHDPGGKYWADLLDVLERQGAQPMGTPLSPEKQPEAFREKIDTLRSMPKKAAAPKPKKPARGR